MDEGARRWLFKTARKNFWRVARWYDLDDLVHEGYAVYYEVRKRYPSAIDPPHQMALFKRIFMTRLCDMAKKRTLSADEVLADDLVLRRIGEQQTESLFDSIAAGPNLEDVKVELAHAPRCVQEAVGLFCDGDPRLSSRYRKIPVGRFLQRETLNDRLCRLIDHELEGVDLVGMLRRFLGAEPGLVVAYHSAKAVIVERKTRTGRRVSTEIVGGRVALCSNGCRSIAPTLRARAVRRSVSANTMVVS